ncbi:MAG: hypothetical protein DRP09_18455 [Candidatus Thorarchaeota archaeon]|nr:MAG: hypothetical protein DRP09_18455 [Candidatus Thorarchaeota archaeon]
MNIIAAYEEGSQVSHDLTIGYVSSGFFHILEREQPAEDMTTEWNGQIILHEGDQIRAVFNQSTNGDKLYLFANGYKIPTKI